MSNTYTWNFPTLERKTKEGSLSDVVKNIHYRYTATSDQKNADGNPYSATIYGKVGLGDADSGSFTAFDSITTDQAIAWTLARLEKTEKELQSALDETVANQITPPLVSGVPSGW
tara:strand:- start:437 stop:781 length:345 start_codon:yes stop_codon:yes gene_type:complete